MKSKHVSLNAIVAERLKDAEFRIYFKESKALTELCRNIAMARKFANLTQTQLAKQMGTTQSVIARLENGNNGRMPSLDLLARVAKALKLSLVVGFERAA